MMRLQASEVNALSEAEGKHSLLFAFAVAMATLGFMIVGTVGAVAIVPNWAVWVFIGTFACGGAIAMFMLILGFRRGRQHRTDFMDVWRSIMNPPEKPKAQEEKTQDVISINSGSLKPPEQYAGFDKEDVRSLCIAFSLGARWSEAALMDKPLPVSGVVLTKVLYYKLIDDVFVKCGIIGARGGAGNQTGKLLISNPSEMMKAIKAAYPPTPPQEVTAETSEQAA